MSDTPVERMDLVEEPYVPFSSFGNFAASVTVPPGVKDFARILDDAKRSATSDQMRQAVDRATRWAAVDTGAIEGLYDVDRGFTMTVAAEAAAWNSMHLNIGTSAAESIEDSLRAYEFVLDAVTESRPITETWVKELHAVICASQATFAVITEAGPQQHALAKGSYKTQRNNPYNLRRQALHAYAPVLDTAPEMQRLCDELSSEAFASADPVLQGAYAHYAFVCIHPFADGNGRVARALASVFLYRSPGVPLVIFADQKPAYIDALEAADGGDTAPFVSFMSDCVVDTVRMVTADLRHARRPDIAERRAALEASLVGRGGMPHDEVDALTTRVVEEWRAAAQAALDNAGLKAPLSARIELQGLGSDPFKPPDRYRFSPNPHTVVVTGQASGSARALVQRSYGCVVAKGNAAAADFLVMSATGDTIMDVLVRDLTPTTSPSLRYRMGVAAEDEIALLLDRLMTSAAEALRERGYVD